MLPEIFGGLGTQSGTSPQTLNQKNYLLVCANVYYSNVFKKLTIAVYIIETHFYPNCKPGCICKNIVYILL